MRPPFNFSAVSLFGEPDRLVTFADRYPTASIRPARFEGTKLWLMRVEPQSGAFDLHWPATCCVRTVDLKAGGPVDNLLEVSPLPFGHFDLLSKMPAGMPTFYLAYTDQPYPADDEAVRPSDGPVSLTGAWLGIMFQDRMVTAPWAWFDRIAAAPGAASEWEAWAGAFAGRRTLRLLNSNGEPLENEPITIISSGQTMSAVSDGGGDLGPVPGGATISWQPPASPSPLPLMNLLDSDAVNVSGDNSFELPATFTGGHLQLLDLSSWFAPYLHPDPLSEEPGARFRSKSQLEPLVDGEATFARMLEDLEAAKHADGAAYFAGWAFKDFPLRPGDDDTRLDRIAEAIVAAGGDVKILAARFLQASPQALDSLSREAALILIAILCIAHPKAVSSKINGSTDTIGIVIWSLIAAGVIANFATGFIDGEKISKLIEREIEETEPAYLEKLAAICRAVYSPHPATVDDNPLAETITLPDGRELADLQNRFGIFHQKIQAIVKGEPGGDRYSAYVGGIDINTNRLDSPGHSGAAWREPGSADDPHADQFHDVHCRITGPAASEAFHVMRGRNAEPHLPADPNPEVVVPALSELGEPGRHVIQVAQTSYRSHVPGGAFPWAINGNRTTHDTFVNGIKGAREHIYIEEQYMVPDDDYMSALIGAADHCSRLAILLPSYLEVPFADTKRALFFDDLAGVWGDRLYIGTPVRRPVLDPPGRMTSRGRMTLLADIPDGAMSSFLVGPAIRVPSGPFFLWIEGELIYAISSTTVAGPDGEAAKELQVLRGGIGTQQRWCPDPRAHAAGAAVTAARPQPIFLHSKIMMVDDLFVAIGSTNINRRGFFHDGEITAFAIPEQLRSAVDNPALLLRTRLWGEQLGLTPELAAALFRDPIAGFELFKRSRYDGNRVVPYSELKVPVPKMDELPGVVEQVLPSWATDTIKFSLQLFLEANSNKIFNTAGDPTTSIEMDP